jgi:hypothetical protein
MTQASICSGVGSGSSSLCCSAHEGFGLDDGSDDRLIRRHEGRGERFVLVNGRNAYKRSDLAG